MRMVNLDEMGFPGHTLREDGTLIMPNGRILAEPYSSGQVRLVGTDGPKYISFAKLIAMAFVENPNGYDYVIHLDGNRWNFRADNLEWVPQKFRSTTLVLKNKRKEIIMLHTMGRGVDYIMKETSATRQYVNYVIKAFERTVETAPKAEEPDGSVF